MRAEDISIGAIWLVLLLVVGALLTYTLGQAVQAAGDVFAAIISGAALLLGGILTHALTEIREQRMVQQERMRQNYERILDRIDTVVRGGGANDSFSKIHLESWVVGSPEVIEHTKSLIKTIDPKIRRQQLESLVKAMRTDLGLTKTGQSLGGVFGPAGYIEDEPAEQPANKRPLRPPPKPII